MFSEPDKIMLLTNNTTKPFAFENKLPALHFNTTGVPDAADMDGDGDTDLVVSNGELWWLENKIAQLVSAPSMSPTDPSMVYPNPCTDILYLKNDDGGSRRAECFTLAGRRVFVGAFQDGRLDVARLEAGAYVLRLSDPGSGRSAVLPFVKRR